jgi:two-component system, chemotaxis family, protein-glutamate methylesterase/glutaminase
MVGLTAASPHPLLPPPIIGIASSAGGIHALKQLLPALPQGFPAPIVLVQHIAQHQPSFLVPVLNHHLAMKVKQAEGGDILEAGTIYVAPPNWHVMIEPGGIVRLSAADPVHYLRPSADVLFASLALSCEHLAIAVVLSGTGTDGATGITSIKKMGGTVIAQDRDSSQFFGMADAAIRTGNVDFVLPLVEIAPFLISLVTGEK